MVDTGKKIIKGASYFLIFSVLAAISGYLLRFVLARQLTIEDFGLFYAVFAFVSFFSLFKDLGLGGALIKFVSEFRVNKEYDKIKSSFVYVLGTQICSVIIFFLIILLLKNHLVESYFHDPRSATILFLVIAWLFVSVFQI
jgi:O-antigen/teichoic acid export membrane protein